MRSSKEKLTRAARTLGHDELIELVIGYAADDAMFASRLLARAKLLEAPTAKALARMRELIGEAGRIPARRQWDLNDIVKAGRALVYELGLLAEMPPIDQTLVVVEEAARVWDELAGYLYDAWETYEDEPGEIGGQLRGIHLRLCEALRPDPLALAGRLAEMAGAASFEPCLDVDDYRQVLGPEGLAEYRRLTGRR